MSVLEVRAKFLYPHSRQYYPIDVAAEKIVRALEKRNFDVPGIEVKFDSYGSGEEKYKYVSDIFMKSQCIKMHFGRSQGKLCARWYDVGAVSEIFIPREQLRVYEDESGPTYYLYVGEKWEEDKEWFLDSIKAHAKLLGEPRKYLKYTGDVPGKRRSLNLITDNDCEREYDPEEGDPTIISLTDLYQRFGEFLEKNVLEHIEKFPEKEGIVEELLLIPYEGPWKTIYSLCNGSDRKRILMGKKDKNSLPPEWRHAHFGRNRRLLPSQIISSENLNEKVHDGFIWADPNPEAKNIEKMARDIRFYMSDGWLGMHIVTITLKYCNDVYVIDNARFEEERMRIFDEISPRDTLTPEEISKAYCERAKTFIPITEYKGGYKEPVVLIERELDFDEIEWVSEMSFK